MLEPDSTWCSRIREEQGISTTDMLNWSIKAKNCQATSIAVFKAWASLRKSTKDLKLGSTWTAVALTLRLPWQQQMGCFLHKMRYLRQHSCWLDLIMRLACRTQLKTYPEVSQPLHPVVHERVRSWSRFRKTKDDSRATRQDSWTTILISPATQ